MGAPPQSGQSRGAWCPGVRVAGATSNGTTEQEEQPDEEEPPIVRGQAQAVRGWMQEQAHGDRLVCVSIEWLYTNNEKRT